MINRKNIVLASPLLILLSNIITAYVFGARIGKWAFIPMILVGWFLWGFFILKFGGVTAIKKWLGKPKDSSRWGILTLVVGIIPLPIFLLHHDSLSHWHVWLPWIILALINPWIEEFYWRGLLLDYTQGWPYWSAIIFTSLLFAMNHWAFGINSEVNRGFEVITATASWEWSGRWYTKKQGAYDGPSFPISWWTFWPFPHPHFWIYSIKGVGENEKPEHQESTLEHCCGAYDSGSLKCYRISGIY